MSGFKKYGFLLGYIFPALIIGGTMAGGWWTFIGFIFAYVIIPILDEVVGKDPWNVTRDEFEELVQDRFFDRIVLSMVYIQLFLVIWTCWLVSFGTFTWIETAGVLLSLMMFTSGGINVAHELGHKKEAWARFHSKLNLMTVCYMHFYIEHNKGHHVNVGTPQDPATSKKNQTFYAFWFQTVIGSWRDAWQIEKRRLESKKLPLWNPIHNQMLQYVIFPILFIGILTLIFSLLQGIFVWQVPLFFLAQSYLAFSSLEAVNYIEHYGLQRREIAPGKFEKVNPLHSWNANHLISNFFLLQLQRHSDHHAYAARPYQILRHFEESPQLPYGYPVMILMSMIPPLFFKVMNKRLEDWKAQAYNAEHIKQVVQATV